jgi:hypothetical protein
MRARRSDEHRRAYFVDRFSALWFALIVATLAASVADGIITTRLLGAGHEEVNPVMACLLDRGIWWFFIGKYLMTALGLPFLMIFKNHYLFGTRFRVGYVIPSILVLYVILIGYELHLVAGSGS